MIRLYKSEEDGIWHAQCENMEGLGETPQDATDELFDNLISDGLL